jgi:NAD(P)-dependent dehydrogenase (short-subunit alcohol dehydrogenase family)
MSVAWVTGAASGIGAAAACRLAAEGAHVACLDIDERRLSQVTDSIGRSGGAARPVVADVADWTALSAAADRLEHGLGPVEIVVAAAGIVHDRAGVADLEPVAWNRVLDINLTGVFLTLKAAIPQLKRVGSGSIVVVASVGGVRGSPGYAGYVASKHGVVGLMRSVAGELADDNIRINAVCPGSVDTPMLHAQAESEGLNRVEAAARWSQGHLLQRLITPDEVAEAVVWLAGDGAQMVTGVALPIDGGYLARSP